LHDHSAFSVLSFFLTSKVFFINGKSSHQSGLSTKKSALVETFQAR